MNEIREIRSICNHRYDVGSLWVVLDILYIEKTHRILIKKLGNQLQLFVNQHKSKKHFSYLQKSRINFYRQSYMRPKSDCPVISDGSFRGFIKNQSYLNSKYGIAES